MRGWMQTHPSNCSSPFIPAHVVEQVQAAQVLSVLHELCNCLAGLDRAAHILEG